MRFGLRSEASRTMSAADPHNLERFVTAQRGTYDRALAEIEAGRKTSHWIWYVFPQLDGLGFSALAKQYGIKSLEEARAYLAHPVLGPRLVHCAGAALAVERRTAREIFGSPDDLKLKSSATLFALAAGQDSVFHRVLDKYFGGQPDPAPLELLKRAK
jgi:uncharacterized protein (DUF1810 family)